MRLHIKVEAVLKFPARYRAAAYLEIQGRPFEDPTMLLRIKSIGPVEAGDIMECDVEFPSVVHGKVRGIDKQLEGGE